MSNQNDIYNICLMRVFRLFAELVAGFQTFISSNGVRPMAKGKISKSRVINFALISFGLANNLVVTKIEMKIHCDKWLATFGLFNGLDIMPLGC